MTLENLVTTSEGTSLEEAEVILQNNKIEKLPVVDGDLNLFGLITFRDITKLSQKPISNKDQYGRLRVAAAIGVTHDALERTKALVGSGVDANIIDTLSWSYKRCSFTKNIESEFPNLDVVVGNIATADAAKYEVKAFGADAVKVGIGPDLFVQLMLLLVWDFHNFLQY